MRLNLLPGLALAGLALNSVSLARTTDLWVDPATGSDANAGTSAASPLKTLGEASLRASAGDAIHLLPGTFAEATGEVFPIEIPADVRVASTGGRSVTTIDARDASSTATHALHIHGGVELSGVTIQRSNRVHLMFTPSASSTLQSFADVEFVGGQAVLALESGAFSFDDCVLRDQSSRSIRAFPQSTADQATLTFRDCDFTGSQGGIQGALILSAGLDVQLHRCRLTDHSGPAIELTNYGSQIAPSLTVRYCLIARNFTGIATSDGGSLLPCTLSIARSTIVDHVRYGLEVKETTYPTSRVDMSILAGSGFSDVRVDAYGIPLRVFQSVVEDGGYTPLGNNQSGPAGFVAPEQGDYSLRSDSPCLDRGTSQGTGGSTDLLGNSTSIDGDLDLMPAPDLGAIEHAPLVGPSVIRLGESTQLGLSGPAGGFSTLIIAPGGYAPFGATTPFGRLFIQPQGAFRVTPVSTTGGAPTFVDISALLDPSWIGTSIGFQALPRSLAAPAGGAFSNPLLIPVE